MSEQKKSLMTTFANRYGLEPDKMLSTLKATAFKGEVTNEQMAALVLVANQYNLNPFTKEIYAFPDTKSGGIVPVVGVDGWSRIVNENPNFDGMDFEEVEGGITCRIYRKDRSHPVAVTEYLSECARGTAPWKSHPKRMLRHKAFIQCARYAFAYTGIYDEDEAERIIESAGVKDVSPGTEHNPAQVETYPQESFEKNLSAWTKMIGSGRATVQQIIATVESKAPMTEEQKQTLFALESNVIEGEVENASS